MEVVREAAKNFPRGGMPFLGGVGNIVPYLPFPICGEGLLQPCRDELPCAGGQVLRMVEPLLGRTGGV